MKALYCVAALVVSSAVSAAATWAITKRYYEKRSENAIEESKKYYENKVLEFARNKPDIISTAKSKNKEGTEPKEAFIRKADPDPFVAASDVSVTKRNTTTAYHKIIEEAGYSKGNEDTKTKIKRPEVIDEKIISSLSGIELTTLILYSDEILADQNDETYDINDTIGYENLKFLPNEPDGYMYVRNEHLGTYYEVIRDTRSFVEATGMPLNGYSDE